MPRDPDQPRNAGAELTPEERGKALGALAAGATQREAAKLIQCSEGAVRRARKALTELSANVSPNGSKSLNGKLHYRMQVEKHIHYKYSEGPKI